MSRRHVTYFTVRAVAGVVFILAATVVPRGIPAALLILGAGLATVATSLGTNAGGPGERAGARPQDRWFDSVRAPQGQWPPYEGSSQQVPDPGATSRTGPAS